MVGLTVLVNSDALEVQAGELRRSGPSDLLRWRARRHHAPCSKHFKLQSLYHITVLDLRACNYEMEANFKIIAVATQSIDHYESSLERLNAHRARVWRGRTRRVAVEIEFAFIAIVNHPFETTFRHCRI